MANIKKPCGDAQPQKTDDFEDEILTRQAFRDHYLQMKEV